VKSKRRSPQAGSNPPNDLSIQQTASSVGHAFSSLAILC
jgi:hypothetical protein